MSISTYISVIFSFSSFWLTAPNFMPMFPAYEALKYLVVILFMLHIMWTYFILKILKRALLSGKVSKLTSFV